MHFTPLGFGAAPLGNLYTEVTDEAAQEALNAAWEAGVRYFDTAPHYGLGLSERRVGRALQQLPRDEFVLQTKVGRLLRPSPEGGRDLDNGFDVPADHTRVWDFSAEGVRRSIEESLERLGLDRIDVALVHDPDDHENEAREGALPELLRLRDEGVIGAVGAGMNQAAMLTRFVDEFDLDVVLLAGCYNLIEQDALDDLLPAALRRNTKVVLGGVYGSGLLASDSPSPNATYRYEPVTAPVLEKARRMAAIALEHGVHLPAVAVQFALAHPAVASTILGMRSADEVRANAELIKEPVPQPVWDALRAEGLVRSDAPLPEAA
ncbi:aldo/keto reductase [Kineosporia babensis]|uniref:Aldo/keto reductase n=1 Tax=Kineosporia babensis TaxID=499548 RepID=A0A9X1SX88_9ACTN|nr:aldo/keto reductase [Kineosporia babensis]MCD5315579.1 aldo/keto reductase [Kineosporia babensis]